MGQDFRDTLRLITGPAVLDAVPLAQPYLLGNAVAASSLEEPGLFQKPDGTVWLRDADGNETQVGAGGSQTFTADAGAPTLAAAEVPSIWLVNPDDTPDGGQIVFEASNGVDPGVPVTVLAADFDMYNGVLTPGMQADFTTAGFPIDHVDYVEILETLFAAIFFEAYVELSVTSNTLTVDAAPISLDPDPIEATQGSLPTPGVPADPAAGDRYLDTDTDIIYTFNGTRWAAPPGTTLDYAEVTTTVSASGTVITGNALTLDGTTPIAVEFFAQELQLTSDESDFAGIVFQLFDGMAAVAQFADIAQSPTVPLLSLPVSCRTPTFTPSAGAHTYSVKATLQASPTGTLEAGEGLFPISLRVVAA